jgi:homoserine O-acetyltransferase/O-succinyltransferase
MKYQKEPIIFQQKKSFLLESGQSLAELEIAYHTFGNLNTQKNNVIWVCHALTANSDASDWWSGLFGEGKILDPNHYFIVCANILGSCYGSTNALSVNSETQSPYYHDFPLVTIRDIAKSLELLRQHLELPKIFLGIGGSLGGQQLLEWAILCPNLFENIIPIATNAVHSAWGIAFNEAQRMAIEADPSWKYSHPQAGVLGMKAARAMALISYRNYNTYQMAQKEENNAKIDGFKASSYQQYQGEKLLRRFKAFSYWTLSKAMDSHNVGRGRGSIKNALQTIQAKTLVMGITSDLLFPPLEQRFIAGNIKNAHYSEIQSLYGHDGFLLEFEKINEEITKFLFE